MSGDPSRRPSNERIKLPGINTMIWVQCRSCFGDGWYKLHAWQRYKSTCEGCAGKGRVHIQALYRRRDDVEVSPPAF